MAVIEARGLTKSFRRPVKDEGLKGAVKHLFARNFTTVSAVDGIDLTVDEGETVAYVGPNGAGKSTTVKMLSGILIPTSGTVRINGIIPHEDRVANAHQIGVLFGQRTQLWWDLPVRDSLSVLRDMYGISAVDYQRQIDKFSDILDLGPLMSVMGRKLSLGQRMRADLAAALLHAPRIVYLDEPTIGLDLVVKDRVRLLFKEMAADGTTLMLTTHDLGDIQDVCKRIVIIDAGKIIHDGPLAGITDLFANKRQMSVQLAEAIDLDALRGLLPQAEVKGTDSPNTVEVSFDRKVLRAGTIIAKLASLSEVLDLTIDEPKIEDVIRQVYAGDLDLGSSATSP